MKKVLPILLMLFVLALTAQADWSYDGAFPDTLDGWAPQAYSQGTIVDLSGKIWYTSYYASETVPYDTSGDGVADTTKSCRAIYVFNSDGTQASFSPIKTITVDGVTDTLWNSNRGLALDPDGNVVAGSWCVYYRINAETGAGMQKLLPYPSSDPDAGPWDGESVTAASFDADGNMFVCTVLPGFPIKAFDVDWELIDEIIPAENHSAYSRTCEVNSAGSAFYYCGFTSGVGYIRFNSDSDVYGDFTSSIDTLLPGLSVEAAEWQPGMGYLWGGNTGGAGYTNAAWYALDPATDTVVDSMIVPGVADLGAKPRGIGFTADGMTAYVSYFNSWETAALYVLSKNPDGVWEHTATLADGYALSANYPNPFNPSTTLSFLMKDAGAADLRVYDLRGAEVAVLQSGNLNAGEHTVQFDASNLAAGIYVARLTVNGIVFNQTMTLVK